MTYIPDVCEKITYKNYKYRVTGWLKKAPVPTKKSDMPQHIWDAIMEGYDYNKTRVIFCLREEAEYVGGAGICGCIAKIEEITCEGGYVDWSEERINEERENTIGKATDKFNYPFSI